jgi:hypothetical protein
MSEIIKKKRGRKPKNLLNNINIIVDKNITNKEEQTEEENIILHLPITLNDIINYDSNNLSLFIGESYIAGEWISKDLGSFFRKIMIVDNYAKLLLFTFEHSPIKISKIIICLAKRILNTITCFYNF